MVCHYSLISQVGRFGLRAARRQQSFPSHTQLGQLSPASSFMRRATPPLRQTADEVGYQFRVESAAPSRTSASWRERCGGEVLRGIDRASVGVVDVCGLCMTRVVSSIGRHGRQTTRRCRAAAAAILDVCKLSPVHTTAAVLVSQRKPSYVH